MIGYILTEEQKQQVHGVFVNQFCFINCVQDIHGFWFFLASQQDEETFRNTPYYWLFNLPQLEYISPVNNQFLQNEI